MNSISLPIAPAVDTTLTCIYCPSSKPVDYELAAPMDGGRAALGVHAACLGALHARRHTEPNHERVWRWFREQIWTTAEASPDVLARILDEHDRRVRAEERERTLFECGICCAKVEMENCNPQDASERGVREGARTCLRRIARLRHGEQTEENRSCDSSHSMSSRAAEADAALTTELRARAEALVDASRASRSHAREQLPNAESRGEGHPSARADDGREGEGAGADRPAGARVAEGEPLAPCSASPPNPSIVGSDGLRDGQPSPSTGEGIATGNVAGESRRDGGERPALIAAAEPPICKHGYRSFCGQCEADIETVRAAEAAKLGVLREVEHAARVALAEYDRRYRGYIMDDESVARMRAALAKLDELKERSANEVLL